MTKHVTRITLRSDLVHCACDTNGHKCARDAENGHQSKGDLERQQNKLGAGQRLDVDLSCLHGVGRFYLTITEYKVFNSSIGCAMLYGHAAEVAIRAALYLAGRPPGELSPVHGVAKATKLPNAYLSKVIQRLAQAGLVRTFRGPGGGIELGKSPDAITLWSLVRATDGPSNVDRCALGIGNCSPSNPCPLHGRWAPLREDFQKLLEGTTLAALVRELEQAPGKEQSSHQRGARRTDVFSSIEATRERQDRS